MDILITFVIILIICMAVAPFFLLSAAEFGAKRKPRDDGTGSMTPCQGPRWTHLSQEARWIPTGLRWRWQWGWGWGRRGGDGGAGLVGQSPRKSLVSGPQQSTPRSLVVRVDKPLGRL